MLKFDSIIIGSGQAGTPLAFKMASKGKKVAFIEKNTVGGTCLNVGCTPTKAYVASARRIWDTKHGDELGIEIPAGTKANLKKIKARKDALIKKSVDGINTGVSKNEHIHFFHGEGIFKSHKVVEVNGEQLTAPEIYINVGARAFIPKPFEEVPYLTNESILELDEIPEHLIVIGGSYIGLEFGQMFRRFGSKVTIIERSSRLVFREDEDVSDAINDILEQESIDIHFNTSLTSAQKTDDGIQLTAQNGEHKNVISGSHVLVAVGRKPNTDKLNLKATGLKTDENGFIPVNDTLETEVKGIFALGDCNGKGAFTHTAYNDYEIIAENKFDGKSRKVSDRIQTYGLYIDPPLGRVGLTKKEALQQGYSVLEAKRPMNRIARAKEKGETNGFMSAVIDADTKQILGAAILGVGGDEIISSIVNVMYANKPYTIIRDSVQPHPTVSELIPTMLENPTLFKQT